MLTDLEVLKLAVATLKRLHDQHRPGCACIAGTLDVIRAAIERKKGGEKPWIDTVDADKAGARIAEILELRKMPGEPGRYRTTWGSKTPQGVCRTVLRMADDIRAGIELIN